MISKLTGQIAHIESKYMVLDVHGVGYKIFTTSDIMSKLKKDEKEITLWTYLAVRENALDLYGFLSLSELNFFELLITISGIGPKTALSILNSASVHSLETAVQTGDTSHLTKINGISKKVAEKIVRELENKIEKFSDIGKTEDEIRDVKNTMKNNSDALEALKSLGYSQNDAREALKHLPKEIIKTNDKIREALKALGK